MVYLSQKLVGAVSGLVRGNTTRRTISRLADRLRRVRPMLGIAFVPSLWSLDLV